MAPTFHSKRGASANNGKRKAAPQKRPKKKVRKIQFQHDGKIELSNDHMRNMIADTSATMLPPDYVAPRPPIDWHALLLQPSIARDGDLAPEVLEIWHNNMAPARGEPFPYAMAKDVEVARQQQQEEETDEEQQQQVPDDDEMPMADDDTENEKEEQEDNEVEVPFPDDDEAPPMPDDFADMEVMQVSEEASLSLANDALDDNDEPDRQQAGDEAVSSTSSPTDDPYIGRKVRKKFTIGKRTFFFSGRVVRYKCGKYVVHYDDGENWEYSGKTVREMLARKHDDKPSQTTFPIGTVVQKKFDDNQVYSGKVTSYNPQTGWYWVGYDDGDDEEFDEEELLPLIKTFPVGTHSATDGGPKMRPTKRALAGSKTKTSSKTKTKRKNKAN